MKQQPVDGTTSSFGSLLAREKGFWLFEETKPLDSINKQESIMCDNTVGMFIMNIVEIR